MTAYLLRTLTRKSTIPAGKNQGLTVQEVLQKSKSDLIYSYFNYNRITFTDDILDELRINPADRIQKPGKDPEMGVKYINRNMGAHAAVLLGGGVDLDSKTVSAVKKSFSKGKFKARYKALIERERIQFSKSSLQRKNQGKK
jgi:hypothetical protein